ncbi:MAG: methylmalonyl-CoA mutase family protein [Deltaproteobacteria bacterium]|nr:methylmalonyl-CoA mutase family protein [Deltaproteobacteria bacterium]
MAGEKDDLESIAARREEWEEKECRESFGRIPARLPRFSTVSDMEVKALATPADVPNMDYERDLGFPGCYPYTRGAQASMYRGRLWTMRQFAGFGTARDTNGRYKYLLSQGQTGLSVAFHYPTLMGYDSDHPRARGEVGKCGVAIDSLADMEVLFDGIPFDKVTTSMTINGPAAILLAMYIAVAEKQGIGQDAIGGTIQNDILKEYIAQKSWIFPPRPSMRLIVDTIAYCTEHVPRWNTISVSGYHIREAGSTAVQELAFTLADGIGYVQAAADAGLDVDAFAPRLSFFFNAHVDFFEEVAKYRAARRIWARVMKERFGAKRPDSLRLRFHTQTAGCTLTAQQPMNNVVRTTIEALAAVMGGTQSLHTNSMDETLALPSEQAVTVALRTQQIIAEESGVPNTMDPLGGSFFVEWLTGRMEADALEYIRKIDDMGGIIPAVEQGYPQREIADAAYHYQQQLEKAEKVVVGVNKYVMEGKIDIPILKIGEEVEAEQRRRLAALRAGRDGAEAARCLEAVERAARGTENMMPYFIRAVKAYCTLGEIIGVLRRVFGEYKDPGMF